MQRGSSRLKLIPSPPRPAQWWGLFPPSNKWNVNITDRPINAYNVGRNKEFNNASYHGGPCPSYIVGSPGCAAFAPTLTSVPSGYTQLLFESAGGNKNRYYIRQAVGDAAGGMLEACSCEGSERRPGRNHVHVFATGNFAMARGRADSTFPCAAAPVCTWLQSRVTAGCSMNYIGMDKSNCAVQTTQLYTFTNSSASLVWLIQPVSTSRQSGVCSPRPSPHTPHPVTHPSHPQVAPDPPTIDATSLKGATLNVLLTPPAYTGFSGAWLPG